MRWISALAPTSMPRVGWSRMSTRGAGISHLASSTFCWLPPESVPVSLLDAGRDDPHPLGEIARDRLFARRRPGRAGRKSAAAPASVSLARIGNGSTRPCWWRSSGSKADAQPHRLRRRARSSSFGRRCGSRPRSGGVMPNSISATSERPAPTRPKKPRISPARSSKLDVARRSRRRTGPRREAPASPIAAASLGKNAAGLVPIMPRTVFSGVSSAVGPVTTRLPERRIVTSSPSPRISSMKWLMNRMATPCAFRRRRRSRTGGRPRGPRSPRSARPGPARAHRCDSARAISIACRSAMLQHLHRAGGRRSPAQASEHRAARLSIAGQSIRPPRSRLAADEDVLGDRQVGEQRRMLVDHGDAVALRVGGAEIVIASPSFRMRRSSADGCRRGS